MSILQSIQLIILGALLTLLLPFIVLAHSLGSSIEIEKDGYLVDIGYAPDTVTAGTQTRFDFELYDNETNDDVFYDNIWLRIEQDGKLYFAGGIAKQRFGATGITYRFVDSGEYDVYVRYSSSTNALVEVTSKFSVLESSDTTPVYQTVLKQSPLVLVGLVLGAVLVLFLNRRKRLTNNNQSNKDVHE